MKETQNYPYFVQLYGDAIWISASYTDTLTIDRAILAAAQESFSKVRDGMFQDRFVELKERGLIEAAEVIANVFGGGTEAVHEARMIQQLQSQLGTENAYTIIQDLSDLGYLWPLETSSSYEPGISSLMTYVDKETTIFKDQVSQSS